MAVLDDINNRIVIVAPNLQVARSVALPLGVLSTGIALRWPETVIVSGMASAADSRLEPLHVVALDRLSGRIVRSFGAASVPTDFAPWTLRQSFERTSPDTIWIADSFRYQLRRTNGTGTVVATYDRNPEWFSGQPEIPDGTRNNPPAARIQGISVDESGRLWVFLHVAAPTWPDAWARVPQGAREYPAGLLAMDKLLRPIVEVIDPAAGRVVARIELDGWIISALPGGRAAFYAEDELGTPSVRIVQFTIRKLSSDARLRANGGQTGAHIR